MQNDRIDYGSRFTHNGYVVVKAEGKIDVIDPAGWGPGAPDGVIVRSFDYGDGWIADAETGANMLTDDAMATVYGIVDNVDVNGLPDLTDEGWTQCQICGTLGDFDTYCSDDCVRRARD